LEGLDSSAIIKEGESVTLKEEEGGEEVSESKTVKLAVGQVRELFRAVGATNIAEQSPAKLQKKLNEIQQWGPKVEAPADPSMKRLFKRLLKSAQDGATITISQEEAPKAEKPAKEAKPQKEAKASPEPSANGRTKAGPVAGYSASAVGKAMGKAGWDVERAKKVLHRLAPNFSDVSIRTAVSDGRSEKYSKGAAPLTKKELEALETE
jgi:hypothetical protein